MDPRFDYKASLGACDLTLAVATINAWNRFAISSRTVPGSYQPAGSKAPEASRRLS
jgi:hypothetical protein